MANLLGIDPKKFKHIKSDEHSTVLQHKDGHTLRIAHNVLNPESKAQLQALSKMSQNSQTSNQAQEAQDQQPGKKMAGGGKIKKTQEHPNSHPQIPMQPNDIPGPTTLSYADGGDTGDGVLSTIGNYITGATAGATTQPYDEIKDKHQSYYDKGDVPPAMTHTITRNPNQKAKGGEVRKMYADPQGEVSQDDAAPDQVMTPMDQSQGKQVAPGVNININSGHQQEPVKSDQIDQPKDIDTSEGRESLAKIGHAVMHGLRSLAGTDRPALGPINPQTGQFVNPPQGQPQPKQGNQQPNQGPPDQAQQAIQQLNTEPPPVNDLNQAQKPPNQPQDDIGSEVDQNEQLAQQLNKPAPLDTPTQKFQEHKQNIIQDMSKEDQAWAQDLKNQHITPKTYSDLFADKSTLGKIGMIFGMLAGGAGSALAHQPNLLLEMMNKQIDNDLQAQKQSKSNAYNYLNLANQHEKTQAEVSNLGIDTQTRAYALSKMRMNQAALHTMIGQVQKMPVGSPQRAQAEQTLAMMNSAVQNENYNIADRAATAEAYQRMVLGTPEQGAQQQGIPDPAKEIRKKQLVGAMNPEQASKALEEVKNIENHQQVNKNALDSFDKVAQMVTLASKMSNPIQNSRRIDAEWYPMMDKLTKDTEGRVTPITVDLMSALKPQTADNPDTKKMKRQKFNSILHAGFATPTLDSFNIPINKDMPKEENPNEGKTATNQQGQKIIMKNGQWMPYNGR